MSQQIKLFENQVSGKTAKFTSIDNKTIYKELSKKQYIFYQYINSRQIHQGQHALLKYIPKFLGKQQLSIVNINSNPQDTSNKGQWILHISQRFQSSPIQTKQFIALQNLSIDYKYPVIMDIKLGKKKKQKSSNKKFQKSTTNSHNFRVNGMSNYYVNKDQHHFISKYYFQKISQDYIQAHLAFFFFDGETIDLQLINKCIEVIKDIVLALFCYKTGNFDSASLLIMYDAYDHSKYTVKIIDFDKYYMQTKQKQYGDQNIIIGLKYIIQYLNNITTSSDKHEKQIKQQNLKIFHELEVVPQEKIKKYLQKSAKKQKKQQKQREIQRNQRNQAETKAGQDQHFQIKSFDRQNNSNLCDGLNA